MTNTSKNRKNQALPISSPVGKIGGAVSPPLLYLNSNNSIVDSRLNSVNLTSYHKKQAFILAENVDKFVKMVGLNKVGFLTLTFPDNVIDPKEAQRRFNSFKTNFMSKFFGDWMLVKERQLRGAWHYHILIDCRIDIRSGINWDEIHPPRGKRAKYSSACPALRSIWRLLRERLPAYGFGRSELLPIRKTSDAISLYMGKYISKHLSSRAEEDKGVRLVSYSSKWPKSSVNMAWNTKGAKEWRRKVKKFADKVGVSEMSQMAKEFGPRWAYHLFPVIEAIDTLKADQVIQLSYSFISTRYNSDPRAEEDHYLDIIDDILFHVPPDFIETGQGQALVPLF